MAKTEIEELVEFLGSPQPHIRRIAAETSVGYSLKDPKIFKVNNLQPINDLMTLVADTNANAENALTMLTNLTADPLVIEHLLKTTTSSKSDKRTFIHLLMARITDPNFPCADLVAMLLANLAKHHSFPDMILGLETLTPPSEKVSTSKFAIDQLMDLFVRGSAREVNPNADFDYLSYVFADVSRTPNGRKHFLTPREYDGVIPITKITVFTEHGSPLRRRGVASTIKNTCFDVSSHPALLAQEEVNLIPYILLPLMGPEEYPDSESATFPEDLQLLPPTKKREAEIDIIKTHVQSILLLATKRSGRNFLRDTVNVYPVLREAHLAVHDDEFREEVDRVVQLLMADEDERDPDPELEGGVESVIGIEDIGKGEVDAVVGEVEKTKVVVEEDEDEDDDDDKVVEIL